MITATTDRIKLKRLIDRELDTLYGRTAALGREMGKLFKGNNRSQLRNLETVVTASTRSSALKNHIKNQTGKDRIRPEQHQTWARRTGEFSLGEQMLKFLDDLGGCAKEIVNRMQLGSSTEDQQELARTVEIELQRGAVQTAVCAAIYADMEAQR